MFLDRKSRWCAGLPALAGCVLVGAIWAQDGAPEVKASAEFAEHIKVADLQAKQSIAKTSSAISSADLREYVGILASREYEGRGTGLKGERMATAYLAKYFETLGLQSGGDDGGWFQSFPVPVGMEMTGNNVATIGIELSEDPKIVMDLNLEIGRDAQPVGFSENAKFDSKPIVFAGFGIQTETYNSYQNLDVKDKWVLVFRATPSGKARELAPSGPLLVKARLAKKLGAAGILFVKGKTAAVSGELVDLALPLGSNDQLPSLSLTNDLAEVLFKRALQEDLTTIWDAYDKGRRVNGSDLDATLKGEIQLKKAVTTGRNTLARLVVGEKPSTEVVIIGAPVDHIGFGNRGASRAEGPARALMHVGADDNASGVAALMEIAQKLALMKKEGTLNLKRDVIFGAWSGEEMGLYGSKHFVGEWEKKENAEKIVAYLNMDMVGRWKDKGMILHGVATSAKWEALVEDAAKGVDLRIEKKPSPFLPTDMISFYRGGVPVLAAFTGLHGDYHKPTDTPEKLDYEGMKLIADFMLKLTLATAGEGEALDYVKLDRRGRPIEEKKKPQEGDSAKAEAGEDGDGEKEDRPPEPGDGRPKVVLGIFFGGAEDEGLLIGGVSPDSAASEAGLEAGDVISKLNGKDIRTREHLLSTLMTMEPDKSYPLEFLREGKKKEGKIKPRAR